MKSCLDRMYLHYSCDTVNTMGMKHFQFKYIFFNKFKSNKIKDI